MKILAIETATPASSVALGDDAALRAMAVRVDRRGHGGFLVSAIDFCFQQAGWEPRDLDVIAVDLGPGPYTGIRAGIAVAQGIAAAVGAPVVAASAVTVLALRAATGRRLIWPIVDVRRGEVATAPFRPVPGGVVRDGPTEIVSPAGLRALIDSRPTEALLVGDIASVPEQDIKSLHGVRLGRPRFPSAEVLLEIAAMRAEHGEFADPEHIRPLYMREPDTAIAWSDFREEGMWPGSEQ